MINIITRYIYPLRLREFVAYRVRSFISRSMALDVVLYHNSKIKLDLSSKDIGHQLIILCGYYEKAVTNYILSEAKKENKIIFIDVGANYGYYSTLWAAQKKENKVIAFEASKDNIDYLNKNVVKNNLEHQVVIENVAVGKEKGELVFEANNNSGQTGWGGFSGQNVLTNNTYKVQVITLDDYCKKNEIDYIDVLKIDVEGADTWVLEGAIKLIQEHKIGRIFFELNISRMRILGIKEETPINYLKNHNYKVVKISTDEYMAYSKRNRKKSNSL